MSLASSFIVIKYRRILLISDLPLVEEFEIKENYRHGCPIAWLEDKLYVAFKGISSVRVFADRAPFEELEETIEIENMDPFSMTSSAANRSIFIGDSKGCIWKIQMPEREVSRWEIVGEASDLSITPKGELLAGVTGMDEEYRWITCSCQLNVFDLTISSRKVIPLPKEIIMICGVVQTQNENFVISYAYKRPWCWYMVSILSSDGVHIIRTVGPESLDLNPRDESYYYFVVMDDGQILASDCNAKLLVVNSDLTGCRILSNNGHTFGSYSNIVYVREKRQLFVHGIKRNASDVLSAFISVFHLSPCYSEAQKQVNT